MNVKITIDKISGHDQEATIGKIYKQVGDEISEGDILFTLESSKGSMKYTSKYNGVISELTIDDGDIVKKKQVVGSIESDQECIKETSVPTTPKKTGYSFGINTPTKEDIHCDVLIIGGGPGGYVAGIRAAQLGLKTVIVEKDHLGGTCLNYGCIPTKSLVQSALLLSQMKESSDFGFNIPNIDIDFEKVMSRKDEVVHQLVSGIQGLMDHHQIRVIQGQAVAKEDMLITVKTKKIDATITPKKIILATGAMPIRLPIEGGNLCEVITSKEVLELKEIPKSMTIIGGGIIGMEIAFIYNELGCEVSVVEFIPRILSCIDTDVSEVIRQSAIAKGIHIYDGAKATSIRKTMNHTMVTELEVDEEKYLISSDKVLMAVGRKPNLEAIDLSILGVDLNERQNGVKVDEFMLTSNPDIYAIGDITNIIQLAHVASHQGMTAAEHIAGINNPMHYDLVPSAIFTMPEVGTVGVNEIDAQKAGLDVKIVKFPFIASGKAIAMNEPNGFVKLIVDKTTNALIGGAIIGAHGTDLIAILVNLIQQKIEISEALKVIYAHPTLAESIHEALLMVDNRGIHFG